MMKRALLVGLVLVAGCEKKKGTAAGGNDCEIVSKDPEHAVAELSKKYPKDAVKVAKTIEDCVAPAGDECERVAAMVKAIPSMMPGTNAPRSAEDYAKTCVASPPEMRKCFLASYALAHDAECKKVMMDLAAASTMTGVMPDKACDGGSIAVFVTKAGVWIASGEGKDGRCFKGSKGGGALDVNGLQTELGQWSKKDCKPAIVLAAENDVRYQDMITVMDVAVKVGLTEVAMAPVGELPVKFEGAEPATAAEHCPATTIQSSGSTGSTAAGHKSVVSAADPTAPTSMAKALIVVVTRDAIEVRGGEAGSAATPPLMVKTTQVMTVASAAKGTGPLDALAKELPKAASPDVPLIVQADQQTSALVVSRVIETAKAAGYTNILFAVKNK
jgi:biopolymer transport protein ExbD